MKPKPRNLPCSQCGRYLSQSGQECCPVCLLKLKVELHRWRERVREENRKYRRLHKLKLALIGAGRYLEGFDATAITNAIEDAANRPVSVGAKATVDINSRGGEHAPKND